VNVFKEKEWDSGTMKKYFHFESQYVYIVVYALHQILAGDVVAEAEATSEIRPHHLHLVGQRF